MTPAPTTGRAAAGRHLFAAVLQPNASLGHRGFVVLMSLVGAASLGLGAGFALMGAWPVLGFFGLDAALLYLMFRSNYRSAAGTRETVRLGEDLLTVERTVPSGRTARWGFQPGWLRVECRPGGLPRNALVLSSHGRSLAIGAFLAPEERAELARALNDALARWRRPAPAN